MDKELFTRGRMYITEITWIASYSESNSQRGYVWCFSTLWLGELKKTYNQTSGMEVSSFGRAFPANQGLLIENKDVDVSMVLHNFRALFNSTKYIQLHVVVSR